MRLRRFTKTPDEIKRYGVDYSQWLDTTEQVNSTTLAVSGPDNTLTATQSSISSDGRKVAFFVSGGTSGKSYNVYVEARTTIGQLREDTIPFVVVAP